MELILSRRCNHRDWRNLTDLGLLSCLRCGFTLMGSQCPPSRRPADHGRSLITDFSSHLLHSGQAQGSYKYRPLDLTVARQIRILVIKPGVPASELHCALEHVNLQDSPNYEAVSYTWADDHGDDSLSHRLRCEGDARYISITKNCKSVLRRLRKPDVEHRIWVDAVCIDQTNVKERNHQVQNMAAIYRHAQRTVVYLGDGNHHLERLLEYLISDCPGDIPSVRDILDLFDIR